MTGSKSDRFIKSPNLPENDCSVIIAGGLGPEALNALEHRGIKVIPPIRSTVLPGPTADHADMLMTYFGNGLIELSPEEYGLTDVFESYGCRFAGIGDTYFGPALSHDYPGDAVYNICIIGDKIVAGKRTVELNPLINKTIPKRNTILVNQGYAKCSICVVNMNTIITEDRGVAKTLKSKGMEVQLIDPGYVRLEGYDRGFFGGCCGLISKHLMAFNGELETHPQSKQIHELLYKHDIEAVNLTSGPLNDFGSFIQLREYI